MAGSTDVWTYLASPRMSPSSGWSRFAVSSANTASTNSSISSPSSLFSRDAPLLSSAASSVANHWIAAGSSIVRAIDAAVSPSMLSVVTYCSSSTS